MTIDIPRNAYKAVTKFTFYLYLFFNLACLIYFSFSGYLGGDLRNQNIPSDFLLLSISFIIVFITFYFFLKLIPVLAFKIRINYFIHENSSALDIISLFIIFFGAYSAIVFKVGVFGLEDNDAIDAPPIIRMFSALIQPIYFGLLYLFYSASKKSIIYKLNFILYIIFILSAGQTAQLLLLFLLFLYNAYINKNFINFKKVITITAICIFIYPLFRLLKDIVIISQVKNTELLHNIKDIIDDGLLDNYLTYLFVSLERFQIISNIQVLLSNHNDLYTSYNLTSNDISKFFSNYWLIPFIVKSFGFGYNLLDYYSPQSYFAYSINGKSNWASHIGQIGYFIFYGYGGILILLFSTLLSFFSFLISKVITQAWNIRLLTWLLTLQLICHGWIFAYVAYLQSLVLFLLIIVFIKGYKKLITKYL